MFSSLKYTTIRYEWKPMPLCSPNLFAVMAAALKQNERLKVERGEEHQADLTGRK